MKQSTLRELAREALRAGKLPNRRPDWLWGGPAHGVDCSVCGQPVSPGETAFEAEFGDPRQPAATRTAYSFHVRCFATWELERDNFAVADGNGHNGVADAEGALLPGSASAGTISARELDSRHREEST
jgi:hypothetical protein